LVLQAQSLQRPPTLRRHGATHPIPIGFFA